MFNEVEEASDKTVFSGDVAQDAQDGKTKLTLEFCDPSNAVINLVSDDEGGLCDVSVVTAHAPRFFVFVFDIDFSFSGSWA